MVAQRASDLFINAGVPIHAKIDGKMCVLNDTVLDNHEIRDLICDVMSDKQINRFERECELNKALQYNKLGRFRVNVFRQRSEIVVVLRHINATIPSFSSLGLPDILPELAVQSRGLVLIVGATNVGKSTTLAAMVDHRNENVPGHILTIEDPIEYVYQHKKSIVNQREVGLDTLSYENALKNALREAPDAILIGEIREREAMQYAITYAENGHLCLSTLHASNGTQALERILSFFPDDCHKKISLDLALNLRTVIAQRLIPGKKGQRVVAVEVMKNTPYIADLIAQGKIGDIKEAMKRSTEPGMQSFDDAIFELYSHDKISQQNAMQYADSEHDMELLIRLGRNQVERNVDDLNIKQEKDDDTI